MTERHLVLGLGELLWDLLPEGPRLGGAPANFAVMNGRLGNHSVLLSRIGRDDLGRSALEQLQPLAIDTGFVQTDADRETGRVTVAFEGGQPNYTIHQPAAWDFLELSDEWIRLAERADAICFGSLAQRSQTSRQTIQSLVAQTPARCVRVFDVNLRAPYYSSEVVQESLELATVFKTNDAEVPEVLSLLGLAALNGPITDTNVLRAAAERLLIEFPGLRLIAITRGGHGSLLVANGEWHEHPGIPITVADTIGAGDAFTAALVHYLLQGASLARLNEAGNRWGGWVASQSGAMPALSDEVRTQIEDSIEA